MADRVVGQSYLSTNVVTFQGGEGGRGWRVEGGGGQGDGGLLLLF
jgi:hypothetical protein